MKTLDQRNEGLAGCCIGIRRKIIALAARVSPLRPGVFMGIDPGDETGSTTMSDRTEALDWPTPQPGQARLTLVGSPHLANPGHDEHNLRVDDTLAAARQEELVTVCTRLQRRAFDHIAVEIPSSRQAGLDDQYAAVRDGLALDDEDGFPDGPGRIRGEAVQIGFRLAGRLGHDRVRAVDSRPEPPDIDADWDIDADPDAVPYPLPDIEQEVAAEQERLRESTLLKVLRDQNRGQRLRTLQTGNIAAALSSSDGDGYTGSKQVGFWYERNARMLENLRGVTGPDERTLFIVGASHVVPVKQLAQAAPATCPRSPLPLLE